MRDKEIVKKLIKQTKREEITWTRHFKKSDDSDPRFNVYYECKLKADNAVRFEYDEETGLTLSFFDIQTKEIFKKITEHYFIENILDQLYSCIQSKELL